MPHFHSVEMVSCITSLILTASHLGYSSAYAIFKCRLLIKLRQVASLSALENDFCKKKKKVHRSYKADLHGMLVF